jgi:hypothetical protein
LSAALLAVGYAIFAVIVQIETVTRMPLIVKAVAHEDLRIGHQLFLAKHLLQTAVGIVS